MDYNDPWRPGNYLYERARQSEERAQEAADRAYHAKLAASWGDDSMARSMGIITPPSAPKKSWFW